MKFPANVHVLVVVTSEDDILLLMRVMSYHHISSTKENASIKNCIYMF